MTPIQPFGFVDDFPSKFYKKPETSHRQSNEASFLFTPLMKKHICERRNLDLINQCRYLAAKKGMSKRELKKSIREDEIEGKNYVLSEEFLATLKGNYRDETYIDPHGTNFIGGCWHLPSDVITNISTSSTCPAPSSVPSSEEPSQFVTFTQPNHVVSSADQHGESIPAAADMKKSSLLCHHHQPIMSEMIPLVSSGAGCSRPVSVFGYFNEMFDDCGSSIEDADLNEYLMDTAQFINRMNCNQYYSQNYQQQRPSSGVFLHPIHTTETHNFCSYERQIDDQASHGERVRTYNVRDRNKNEESVESTKNNSAPQEIALKNYFPYSDDDSGGIMSDYSTTDETVTHKKLPTVAAGTEKNKIVFEADTENNIPNTGAFGMRKIQILKKSDSSIFGSRDEYGKIVESSL